MREETIVIYLRFPKSLIVKLDKEANERLTSRNEAMKAILVEYFKKKK